MADISDETSEIHYFLKNGDNFDVAYREYQLVCRF